MATAMARRVSRSRPVNSPAASWTMPRTVKTETPHGEPIETEVCDEFDNDRDAAIDEDDAADASTWYADSDGDGYGDVDAAAVACEVPSGHVADATDCDDSTADASPEETEICDSIDNDCDGEADEDDAADASTGMPTVTVMAMATPPERCGL